MRFHIITIFPKMFDSYFSESIISRAIKNNLIKINTYSLREYTRDKHRRVDGRPYGGGPGMVMWVDPIIKCVEKIEKDVSKSLPAGRQAKKVKILIIVFSPGGERFTNTIAKNIEKKYTDIIFICGRYEGIDARVKKILKAEEISIGEYVLTGGELPAMVCIDAVSRQIRGVLHGKDSIEENRVSSHEMYARPEIYDYGGKKYKVPGILLSGNHKLIDKYRSKKNK